MQTHVLHRYHTVIITIIYLNAIQVIADTINNLAACLEVLGDLHAARPLYEESHQLRKVCGLKLPSRRTYAAYTLVIRLSLCVCSSSTASTA